MFRLDGGRLGDERGFVHKRILGGIAGAAKGLLSGGPLGAIRGGVTGLVRAPARRTVSRTTTARSTRRGAEEKELARFLKFGGPELSVSNFPIRRTVVAPPTARRPPLQPMRIVDEGSPCQANESARCCRLRNGNFREQAQWQEECGVAGAGGNGGGGAATEVGNAVMGRYGAALEPGVQMIERSVCLPGMHLANDGLCYNKGAITNKQRQWPRGRRPLLTGGDMRAIGIAARAGAKMDRTTKRLRALGMMKKPPATRKPAPAPHRHALPAPAVSV